MDFWTWANQNGTGITAVATVALVIAGLLTLLASNRDSKRKSRPMLSAYFALAPENPLAIEFHISNFGQTRATNVRVSFNPEIPIDDSTSTVRARYRHPIGAINPGEIYTNRWYSPTYDARGKLSGNRYSYPDTVTVSIIYDRWWWLKHMDVTTLDVATHINTETTVHSDYHLGTLRKIAKSLDDVQKAIKAG